MNKSINQSINHSNSQLLNQSITQSINQSANQSCLKRLTISKNKLNIDINNFIIDKCWKAPDLLTTVHTFYLVYYYSNLFPKLPDFPQDYLAI